MYRIICGDQQVLVSIICYPFILISLCANYHLVPLYMADASRCYFRGPSLKFRVQYSIQDTIAYSDILRPILWAGCFFVGCSSVVDGYRDIEAAFSVLLSGKLSRFSRPLCLFLSSRISIATVLVVPDICFHSYSPSP